MILSSKQRHISGNLKVIIILKNRSASSNHLISALLSQRTLVCTSDGHPETALLYYIQTNSGRLVSLSLDLKIKPPTITKVWTDWNTPDYVWHWKIFWESPRVSHKAQLLCLKCLSPSIWSPTLAPWLLPPKKGGLWVQRKRHSAMVSWMWTWLHRQNTIQYSSLTCGFTHKAGNGKLIKLYPTTWEEGSYFLNTWETSYASDLHRLTTTINWI